MSYGYQHQDVDVGSTPFGRYRLVELLGRGGMGEVWRAYDTGTDRIVAIKLLPPHFSDNEEFKQRFRREAQAAAKLNTPHVVPIYDYGEIEGRLYVCMRLIEGRDLQSVLADGPLEPSRAVRIIEGVALALHAAHEVGLLHRDIKPSNILLDKNDFAYLIDFGIALAADETRMTKSGYAIGTFAYIAPERLGIRAEEDARADVYSLACVLYECLTGHPPFDVATMAGLVAAHLNTPPPQPSATQPNVPKQIDEVIASGMAKDPDNRYATTVELADAARDAITVPIPRSTPSLAPDPTDPTLAAAGEQQDNKTAQQPTQLAPTQPAEAPKTLPPPATTAPSGFWSTSDGWFVILVAGIAIIAAIIAILVIFVNRHSKALPSSPYESSRTMSGHYIITETNSTGVQSLTSDWYFTSCGDGCASIATASGVQPWSQARLINGQWTVDGEIQSTCPVKAAHYTWDPNTLAGIGQITQKESSSCSVNPLTQYTTNVQLRRAP
jgi:serine/threonine-protein kinase